MKRFLFLLLLPVTLLAQKGNVQYDTKTHAVAKPPTAPAATFDLDFTGLNIGGLTGGGGGGGTPGGANQQLQFNSAFTFGGVPYATYDGTTVTFRTGARFTLADPTDATKRVQLAITGAGLKTVTISDNQVTVTPFTAPANQFLTSVSAAGLPTSATVAFSGLTGTLALSQTTMSSGKLIGRYSASTGIMQEITPDGVTVFLDSGTGVLSAAGGGGTPGGSTSQFQYNNAGVFGGQNSLIFSGGNVLGRSNTFHIFDNSDNTAMFHFSTANIPTATDETVLVPNSANPVVVGGASAVASQWVRYIDNLGIQQRSQPLFSDIGGSPSLAQQSIPINLERFVDPVNGSDISGAANLARPFLTLAGAALAAPAGTVIYTYPNITGYDQGTTPFVIPAGVTIVGAGPDTTLIKGAVTGVTRAVVEPSTSSAIYNVTIQNTSSTGVAFGVGSSSAAFTAAYIGGSKVIAVAQGIYINKAGTTGLIAENTTISTQNDCVFQNISTATSEFRNCDLIADGTVTLTESKGLNIMNGTVRFDYGTITVGGATGTNVGAFGSGATSIIELRGVRIANSLGGATNYDVQQQSSATVGVAGVFRSDAGAIVTNGTVTELSRYAVRDNNLTDFPNIGAGTRGDIIFRNATGWGKLVAGIDGNVLTTHGSTADPTWTAVTGAGGIVDDTAFGVIWNGSTVSAPSQNAAYDYFHIMSPSDNGKIGVLDIGAGIPKTSAGGVVSVATSGTDYVTPNGVETLTNKRITKRRLATAAPGPTPAYNTDSYDAVHFTGMTADITSLTSGRTGTPQPADTLRFDFTDDGTARLIAWGTDFEASPGQALPTTTVASTRMDVGFVWNQVTSKWRCLASSNPIATSGAGTVTSVGLTGANGVTSSGGPITSSGNITVGLPITLAGTAGKTLTVSNSLTLAGTDLSTLNIGSGGTLGTNAFNSTTFLTSSAISDSVFAAAWNGDTTTASSRNSIYDWAHTFDTNDNGKVDVLDVGTAGLVKVDASGNVAVAVAGTDYADLAFRTITISGGGGSVVADAGNDTLTLTAGTGITLTPSAGTDTITIASTGGGSGTVTSVGLVGTTNQITVTGTSPITSSGSFTLSVPASAQLDVAKLTNLTSNGFVKTGSADGTLSVDTATYLTTASAASTYQPLDSDLSTIAGLTATTDNFMVAASSAWASRTPAQARTSLGLVIGTNVEAWDADLDTWATLTPSANFQTMVPHTFAQMKTDLGLVIGTNVEAWDADLDTLAGLTATTDNFIVSVSSAWASRTPAQVRTTLGLVIGTNVQAWDADLDTWATKTAPSGTVIGTTDTQTLTNKRINPRASGGCDETSSSTSTPDSDNCDQWDITALAATDTFVAPSGTPVNGQRLTIRIKDNGTAQTLSFPTGSSGQYKFSSDLAAPTTTILGKTFYMLFIYNTASSRWENVAQLNNF